MTNINISLRKEAYDYLKSLKRQNQSFSDIILTFKGDNKIKKGSKDAVIQFAGILEDINWEKRKKIMHSFRQEVEEKLKWFV